MKQVFEKIKQRITIAATEACGYAALTRVVSEAEVKEILDSVVAEYNNGWIPCSEQLPEVPEGTDDDECPEFNVMIKGDNRATTLRCTPDGTWFDEFGYVYPVIFWQPLPEPYKGE